MSRLEANLVKMTKLMSRQRSRLEANLIKINDNINVNLSATRPEVYSSATVKLEKVGEHIPD